MSLIAASSAQNPLLPNTTELIIGIISFFIVFGALGRVLLPRIQQTLAERTDQIEGGLQRAEQAQAQAQRTLEQYQAQHRGGPGSDRGRAPAGAHRAARRRGRARR